MLQTRIAIKDHWPRLSQSS